MLRFWAYRARREGKPIPRWQLHAVTWKEGRFSLREERDDWLGRTVRVARLTSDRGAEVFPPLIEAQLIHADGDRLILNGIERDELTRCDRAQTWVLHSNDRQGRQAKPPAPAPQASQAPRPEPAEMLPP
jgi:hypothetical protein